MKSTAAYFLTTIVSISCLAADAGWSGSGCKGEEIKVLMGCPFDQASPFVMRVRLQKGLQVPSHSYPVDIGVTMLRGKLEMTFDENGKPRTVTMGPGDFFKVPAYAAHTARAVEETELQDNGIGPVVVTWQHQKCASGPAPDPLKPFCAR